MFPGGPGRVGRADCRAVTAKVYDLRKYRKQKIAKDKRAAKAPLRASSHLVACGNAACKQPVHLNQEHVSQVGVDMVWCSRACWLVSVDNGA